jgi:hypothetical protein
LWKPKAEPSVSAQTLAGLGKTHWWKGNRALGVAIDCALRFIMLERQQDFAPERGMLLYLASPGRIRAPRTNLRAVLTSAASRTTVLPPARPR